MCRHRRPGPPCMCPSRRQHMRRLWKHPGCSHCRTRSYPPSPSRLGARVAGARKTASQLSRGGVGVVSADSARFALFVSRRRLERSLRTCHTAVAVPPVSRLAHASSATGGAFRVARAGHARAVALVTLERVGATNLTLAIQRVAGGAWGAYHLAVVFFVAAQARHAGKISQPSVPRIRDMHRLNTRATKA